MFRSVVKTILSVPVLFVAAGIVFAGDTPDYAATVNRDAKHIYVATQAYFAEGHFDKVVDCAADIGVLKKQGYRASAGIVCEGKMTVSDGSYTVSGPFEWRVTSAVIDYNGTLQKSVYK